MKTVTNYAEKKAKQFLNLLQGYTKGIRFTAILILLLMGVNNAWAYNVKSPHVYFNATNVSSWPGVNIVVGHDSYSFGDLMSKVSNTNLYYAKVTFNGSDANGFVFIGANSKWGAWNNQSLYDRTQSQSNRTDYLWFYNTITDGLPSGTYYFSTSGNKKAIDYSQYTTIPTFNTTSAVRVRTGTSGTYSDASGTYPANISIQGTYISGDGETNRTSITSTQSSDGDAKKVYGSVITGLVTLSYSNLNEAYTFDGWGTSNSKVSSTSTNYEFNQSANTTVYAFFTKKTYTITYKQGANGSGSIAAGTKEHGVNYTLSSNKFTRTGYTQTGWSTSDGGAKVYELGGTYTANTDVTLYPFWTPATYTITLNPNGGASNGSATATYNSSIITNLTQPTRTDYRCNGYYTAASDGTLVLNIDGTLAKNVSGYTDANGNWTKDDNATLYAQWTYDVTEYTVNFGAGTGFTSYGSVTAKNNSTSATITSPATVRSGQSITFTATPKTGYIVEGWYTNAACTTGKHNDGNTTYTTTITAATNVYVKFVEKTWSVSFTASTGGTVTTPSSTPQTVGEVTGINIIASPSTGYSFKQWTSSNGGSFGSTTSASTTFHPTAATTITANFQEIKHTVQVSIAAGQENWGSVSTNSVSVGQHTASSNISATAKTSVGYVFDHWEISDGITITSGNANNATIKITATKDGSLTAHFRGENRPQNVYLIGTMNSWKQSDADWRFYKLPGESGNTVTLTKTINKSDYHKDGYKFGINIFHSDWDSKYWKNSSEGAYKMDAHNCTNGWGFNTDGGDFNTFIDLNVSGEYTFTLTDANAYDKQKLSITYPDKSFIEGDFATAWDEDAYPLTENGNIQTVTIPITSKKDVEFRLVSHGKLFGTSTKITRKSNSLKLSAKNMEDEGAVIKIGADLEGDYKFTYDKSTNTLTVTFPTAYTLTYGSGAGGSGTVTADNSIKSGDLVLAGTSVSLTATPASGYDFAAWYSDQACEGDVVSSNNPYTFSINSNTTLYAKWKAQSFTLTWNLNGGRITKDGTPEGSVAVGTTLEAPTVEKDYYDFASWDPTVPNTMPAANVTYTAQWTPKKYTITYKDQGDEAFSGTHDSGYPTQHTYNTTTTLLGATKSGYTFAGWYRDSECAGARVETLGVDVTEAITLYAKWDVASYTITFDKQEGTGGTTSVTAQYGAKLSAITIPSRDGYLFDGYYTQTSGNGTKYYNADGTTTKTMPHNVSTLYAKWIPYSQCIFFKNTLDWKNVYVYTFSDNVWYDNEDSNTQYGPGVCTQVNVLEFAKMTQIDNTDIYYYILTKQAGFNHIAFSDADMNNWNEFYGNKAIYRADRNDQLPLFIPKKSQTPTTTNSTKYYSSGIWMKYNSTESGYDWRGATDENNQEQWSKKIDFTASKPGGYSFTATVEFDNTSTHYFKIHNTKGDWFGNGGTMTQNNCTDWTFGSDNTQNAKITPTITGKYIFTVYLGDGEVSVSLDYPLSVGDYRLAYKDKTPASHHPGHYLKKHSTSQIDIVSFFIHYDQEPVIFVEKCADIQNGIPTWEKVTEITNNPAASITESGVYNFSLQQIEGESSPILVNEAMPYTGNYYIRTDAAEGGWDSFRQQSNQITYSSFADAHSNFNHYYCKYIEAGRNVKFTIANDYSYCISDTLDNDPIIEKGQSSVGCLPINANVRFGWDSKTNELSRAYIAGTENKQDRFLVLRGIDDNLKDKDGNTLTNNEIVFTDLEDWIYQADVTANENTMIRLTAQYNNQTQYFKGAADGENQYIPVLTGGASGDYKIRFIYNFKSNHLVTAWLADGNNITEDKVLGTDLMIIRQNQDAAAQLKLNSNETKLSEVGTIYATMTFTKDHLESTTASEWERLYYWISFPFDVRISDVFGFGEYGKQWIIEYYDGAARAKNGYWLESDTYWKYISDTTYVAGKSNEDANGNPNNGVLVANKGYVLALARSIANQGLFKNGNGYVRLYFPSMNKIGSIDGDMQNVVTLLQEYPCTITGREAYDNNWHMIGVPSYANKDHTLTQDELIYYYEYQASSNTYQVTTAQRRDPDISSSEAKSVTFKSMHSYMVQYAGTINWRNWATTPQQLAARRNTHSEQDTYSLRLELQRNGTYADQTFVQLKDESTTDYDMNIDLTKLMNSGTNIYTLAGEQRIQLAGSVIPVAETTIPVGVKVAAAGEYTLAMPDGTDGITALLIDYETNTTTDLLLSDYTVTLPKGSTENRFALIVKPRKTATRMENIGEGAKDADKYIIDGALYLQRDGKLYNAQGQIMR